MLLPPLITLLFVFSLLLLSFYLSVFSVAGISVCCLMFVVTQIDFLCAYFVTELLTSQHDLYTGKQTRVFQPNPIAELFAQGKLTLIQHKC